MRCITTIAVLILVAACLCSCTFGKIAYHTFSEINDFEFMAHRPLTASPTPFHFATPENSNAYFSPERQDALNAFHERNNTIALLIIKNDTLIFEHYYAGYDRSHPSMAFSTSKSILSILIGCAIEDGFIHSVEDPVTQYVPEMAEHGLDAVKIEHLLQMTAGLDYNESDIPFARHSQFYYGDHLERRLLRLGLKRKPGLKYQYSSGENQLLGLVLKRAIAPTTITEYLQKRLWNPLGMEYDGMWVVDNPDGMEKTFCGVVACARDFAKFGRLYLHEGNWNGQQIVPREWVAQSTKIDETEGSVWKYQYQWWLIDRNSRDFTTVGHLGQYIYVSPKNDVIIVRLGRNRGDLNNEEWKTYLSELAAETGRMPKRPREALKE